MPIFDGLGRALRWLRERQLKRQYQVAEGAGITKAMLSAYETGKQKPSLDTLEKILDALICDLNDLHNALQIVNGRPERMRNAGGDSWRVAGTAGEGAPSGPGLYEILRAEGPLPRQEEQAMSERLGGGGGGGGAGLRRRGRHPRPPPHPRRRPRPSPRRRRAPIPPAPAAPERLSTRPRAAPALFPGGSRMLLAKSSGDGAEGGRGEAKEGVGRPTQVAAGEAIRSCMVQQNRSTPAARPA